MLLHNRRTYQGLYYPAMWRVDGPTHNVTLYKKAELEQSETITVYANTAQASVMINGVRCPIGKTLTLEPGRHFIKLSGYKPDGFPAFYCIGESFASDESWKYASFGARDTFVGTNDMYTELSDNPEIFKFSYERIYPVASEKINGGTLYDFGKETFGKLIFEGLSAGTAATVICGESREEALSPDEAIVYVDLREENGKFVSTTVAFRYIFVPDLACDYGFSADYEYLPLENKGSFRSDDELINKIWDVADYTLHLNAREGFFDGLKRDRWVWGGDAYQSYFVNYYLMNDKDIVRRTQRILRGADPMTMHINTISDYTFYWIAAMWEYYFHTGDRQFIRASYPDMLTTMNFVMSRLDDNGLYAKRKGDWVFVDWTNFFDKDSGPMCAEQMLLCRAYDCMSKCAALLDDENTAEKFAGLKNELCEKIKA
jgi:hypothetical protein